MPRNLVHQLTLAGSLQSCGTEVWYLLACVSLAVFSGKQQNDNSISDLQMYQSACLRYACIAQINKTGR